MSTESSRAATATERRVARVDWTSVAAELDRSGCALTAPLLTASEADRLVGLYGEDGRFRSTIDMSSHHFGEGQYRYLAYPLPEVVETLRRALYPHLVPIARDWWHRLGRRAPWPDTLEEWLEICRGAGQSEPTPLLLDYGPGGWNALHRDLYGDLVFPLQVVVNLTVPEVDYAGGEFLLVEQRPRAQSRGTALSLPRGRGLVFTTRERPIRGGRGWSAAQVRHGVSIVRSGRRVALGVLFHDAA